MSSWIVYAFASAIFTGIQAYILKIVAKRGYSTNLVNSYALIIASILGLTTVVFFFGFAGNYSLGIGLAAATGIVYMFSTVARTRALRYLDDAFVFSLYKSGTVLIAMVAGIFFFGEHVTLTQTLGILLALVVPFLMQSQEDKDGNEALKKGIILLSVAIVAGALSALINKVAAPLFESALMFGVFNYLFGTVTGFSLQAFEHQHCRDHWFLDRRHQAQETIAMALGLGLAIFLAFSALMLAFKSGPLGIVYTINSLYFIIPIILSTIFLGEKRSTKDIIAVLASLFAVILLVS